MEPSAQQLRLMIRGLEETAESAEIDANLFTRRATLATSQQQQQELFSKARAALDAARESRATAKALRKHLKGSAPADPRQQ